MDAIKVERVILALGGGAKLGMLFGKAMKVDQEKGDTLYLYTIIQIKSGHTKYTFREMLRTASEQSNGSNTCQRGFCSQTEAEGDWRENVQEVKSARNAQSHKFDRSRFWIDGAKGV
ncbi:hypothetical protein N7450_011523 [Penicillium hetheringtonii]|uniref:Uncharacterized protein n=1 Tax=Penicillium hetheringtonii TaxID=911720 RepID=A0AAD6DA40_9EURO|nr:hypothetical protein N7450_011523 [Penicillium hetheringtonii]